MTPVVFTREARTDVAEARRWYERQRNGYGQKFLERLNEAVESISRIPESHAHVEGRDSRLCLVRGFPYVILYRVELRRVVVFSVIHAHRDPEAWPP